MPSIPNTESVVAPTVRQQVQRVAALPPVHAAFGWFRTHENELRDRQLELVRIPAPPFGEEARGEWLRARFAEIGLDDVHVDEVGNVFGLLPGSDAVRPLVAVTAHIDTVFPATTLLNVRREGERLFGPGISDNGAGVTGLMALASAMQATGVPHAAGVLFIGNVGEEGEGDLRGMRHIFSHPRWKDAIGYTVVLDGAATDTIVTQGLGSRRFEVTIHGPGGHSWSDFGMPNPIAVLARAIVKLTQTPLPAEPKTSCNVGVIGGGSSVNSIPESASMRVDIRSALDGNIDQVERALREAVAWSIAEAHAQTHDHRDHVSYEIKLIGNRPAAELDPDAYILQVMRAVDQHLGNITRQHRASTDANIPMSLHKEAISTGAGGSGGGAHTVHEWYDPAHRELGLKRILLAVLTLAGLPDAEKG
ncbi:MAG: M20/M25/M40 family metallo-hydrolase [Acidobacteriia bacterium]|nr:M20/M25/M40 family metallo-hydrolase [Terriglobia bacterium]